MRKLIKVGRQVIAGCYVTDGRIVRAGGVRLWRSGKVIVTDKIDSLRRFKDDVREVQTGFECGIGLVNTTDLLEGDVIECFTIQAVSRPVCGAALDGCAAPDLGRERHLGPRRRH